MTKVYKVKYHQVEFAPGCYRTEQVREDDREDTTICSCGNDLHRDTDNDHKVDNKRQEVDCLKLIRTAYPD